MLALVLNAPTLKENLEILERNRRYVSLAELRVDMLRPSALKAAASFPDKAGLPVILTCRRKSDGGAYTGTEERRKEILKNLSEGSFAYVDLEVDLNFPSLEYALMARGVDIIRSMHDFTGIPRDIPELAKVVSSCGQIPKIAVNLSTRADYDEFVRIAGLLSAIPRKILIGMGKFGPQTRVHYRDLGSMLTYCSESDPGNVGLPPPQKLSDLISSLQA